MMPASSHLPSPPRFSARYDPPACPRFFLLQAVQVQLKRGEKTEKDDESPVTVADYGAQVGCLLACLHAWLDAGQLLE